MDAIKVCRARVFVWAERGGEEEVTYILEVLLMMMVATLAEMVVMAA